MTHKVLIADDEPNIVISLEYLLKRAGYTVLVARDGQQAIDMIRSERPALVLLDVMMPIKSGHEVCAELRADEALRDTRVLMLSANNILSQIVAGRTLQQVRSVLGHELETERTQMLGAAS